MAKKPDRNDTCHCGSGKKYKNCCLKKDESGASSKLVLVGVILLFVFGLVMVGLALSGGDNPQDCPPGTVWSDAHQHCH